LRAGAKKIARGGAEQSSCKVEVTGGNTLMSDSPSELHTRPSLLVRVRDAQDAEAWRTFVAIYGPVVYRYARGRGLQDADAADLMQDVLTEIARAIRGFEYRPERGRFRDWFGTITRRRLARFLAGRDRNPAENGPEAGPALEDCAAAPAGPEWEAEFNAQVLRTALERIRPHFEAQTWRLFERVWLDGASAADAARELGVPVEAAYVAKSRVLKRLEEEVLALAEDIPHLVPLR
jgi:RNA polymerase sigma-70 factor (ECF subfamily)